MNTLYPVDPDERLVISDHAGKIVGTPLVKENGGGHLVSSIDLNNLNVSGHKRWFIADYSPLSGAEGVYVIYDTSDNGRFWQFCTLEANRITTEGNTFTITGPTGSTMRATVLYPSAPVSFKTGTRPRGSDAGPYKNNNFIHFQSHDGSHLVVLTVRKEGRPHPSVKATGTWGQNPRGLVTVGEFSVAINGEEISYTGSH